MGLTKADVMALTKAFRDLVAPLRRSPAKDDRAFAEHLTFVANRVLQRIRKEEWSKKTQEKIWKLLMRLFFVYEAYRRRKGEMSLLRWLRRIASVAQDS